MKTLILKDGTEIQFINGSNISNLTTVVETFNDVEALRQQLSEDNLSDCTFDGIHYTNVILDIVSTYSKSYDNVQVSFLTKTSADVEIEALRQRVDELTEENEQLSDKAEATDILLGNEEV